MGQKPLPTFVAGMEELASIADTSGRGRPWRVLLVSDLRDRGAPVGGMMTKPPHMPQSGWLYYFNVDAIDTAIGRVKAGSREVLHGPMQVPGGSWIAQCRDPQGAMFAMVACKR
jgi:predicted enzyme related to lactoylglutathione lyase